MSRIIKATLLSLLLSGAVLLMGHPAISHALAKPRPAATVVYLPLVTGGQPAATPTPTSSATPVPTATDASPTPSPTATIIAQPTDVGIAATMGVTVSQRLQSDAGTLRYGAVSAVFYASQTANTGGTVTTGTLTVVGPNQFTYAATPTDRLHLILADGRTMDLYVTTLTGTNGSSPDAYLNNTHHFAARIVTGAPGDAPDPNVTLPPNADIDLVSTLANGITGLTVNGTLDFAGTPHTANLTADGSVFFDSSGGSIHTISTYTVTGTIDGDALGLTVAERYRNERIADSRVSVSTADTRINNTWSYAGQRYALQNGLIRRSFQDGYVNESEIDSYWHASGTLLQNNQAIGGLGLSLNALYMEVVLTANGETLLLQRFRRPTTIEP
ncbi:MAG: hypothetical protein KDE19_03475 [Caldilineaceae bacterium]|nr:hypothetical protein [Caldilineaceae bacterium]